MKKIRNNIEVVETSEYVLQARNTLAGIGIGSGTKIAILCDNCPEMAVAIYACWELGAVVVPVNTRFPLKKIHGIMEKAGCGKILVGNGMDYQDTSDTRSYPFKELFGFKINSPCILAPGRMPEKFTDFSDIIFTSGTCGNTPKGVLHTLANHYYSAEGSNENIPFGKNHVWLANLPFYHISGFSLLMRSLARGGKLAFYPENNPAEAVSFLGVTHISLVRNMFYSLIEKNTDTDVLKKLAAILLGGSSIPDSLVREAVDLGLPVYKSYGLTEMSSQVTTTGLLTLKSSLDNYGKILRYRKLRISPGNEILVKGKTLFHGYFEEGRISMPFDSQGWFHTGDSGFLDSEGNLHVSGRTDSMIISGGENIYPSEIENELLKIPGIADAIVVPYTHREYGKIPVAFLRYIPGKKKNERDIKDFLSRTLENYKIPKYFLDWPHDLTGGVKPSRKLLCELASKRLKGGKG